MSERVRLFDPALLGTVLTGPFDEADATSTGANFPLISWKHIVVWSLSVVTVSRVCRNSEDISGILEPSMNAS